MLTIWVMQHEEGKVNLRQPGVQHGQHVCITSMARKRRERISMTRQVRSMTSEGEGESMTIKGKSNDKTRYAKHQKGDEGIGTQRPVRQIRAQTTLGKILLMR